MTEPDYDEPDMAELAGIDPDPDYGRDIDDEDDRGAHGLELAAQSDPLVHKYAHMFGSDLDDEYDEDDEYQDAGEWQPGECDTCGGRDVVVDGPLGPLYCACAIGEGAPLHECRCGTSTDEPGE